MVELYNDYGGAPYEGIALYRLPVDEKMAARMQEWESLPLSTAAKDFTLNVSLHVDFPRIEKGTWKYINRTSDSKELSNASLCVFDETDGSAYFLRLDS